MNNNTLTNYKNALIALMDNDYYYDTLPIEDQYKKSLYSILKDGVCKENRTGIDTIAIQHQYFYMKNIVDNFPILRAKKMYPKMALKELIWMLLGRTDVQWLRDRKVTYWDEWELPDGTIGRSYGYQYRNFNGIDQLNELLKSMDKDPLGRRHIISLWNSADLDKMALPPCMYDYHFSCIPTDNEKQYKVILHSHLRSNDSFLGAPYDFMFCAFFVILICDFLNRISENQYIPGDVHYTADDYHLYVNHLKQVKEYTQNYFEDKEGAVSLPSKCVLDLPNTETIMEIMGTDTFNIDTYLNYIGDHTDDIKVVYIEEPGFKYGPIKADIAV